MMKNILLYGLVVATLIFLVREIINSTKNQVEVVKPDPDELMQPALPVGSPWGIKSIDTQVVSKYWTEVPVASIQEQIAMLKAMNATYVAVATPYDRAEELKQWVDEIHKQGLHVWFRAHWNEWEGDDKKAAIMTPREYLDKSREFILTHKEYFQEGDSFTVAVEPEQVGVGLGKRFADWNEYKNFVVDEVVEANRAFAAIGLKQKVYTNWISTNGWVAENIFDQELVDYMGMITIDHYPEQTTTIGARDDIETMVTNYSTYLDQLYAKFHKPILIGEWGYQIFQDVDDNYRAALIKSVFEMLKSKSYLVGVNYWVHMGNSARLIGDVGGKQLQLLEPGRVVKDMFASSLGQ